DWAAQGRTVLDRTQTGRRAWALGGRLATALGCVILLVLAWPGWLHSRIGHLRAAHRVGWEIVEDPSLRTAAQRLGELHQSGVLKHGFNAVPDIANYCAW